MKFTQSLSMTFNAPGVRVFTAPVYQNPASNRNQNRSNRVRIKGPKMSKRRCYNCSRYGHLARDCLATRKPRRVVTHPPSPSPDEQMEVQADEQVVVVEESTSTDANVENLTGMVANVGVTNDDSKETENDSELHSYTDSE